MIATSKFLWYNEPNFFFLLKGDIWCGTYLVSGMIFFQIFKLIFFYQWILPPWCIDPSRNAIWLQIPNPFEKPSKTSPNGIFKIFGNNFPDFLTHSTPDFSRRHHLHPFSQKLRFGWENILRNVVHFNKLNNVSSNVFQNMSSSLADDTAKNLKWRHWGWMSWRPVSSLNSNMNEVTEEKCRWRTCIAKFQ
jgi:hypothetical protein